MTMVAAVVHKTDAGVQGIRWRAMFRHGGRWIVEIVCVYDFLVCLFFGGLPPFFLFANSNDYLEVTE